MLSPYLIYTITTLTAVILSIFNIVTISVLLLSNQHRSKASTFPLLSFLTGCLIQGFTAAPLFIFKEMGRGTNIVPPWLCIIQRSSYFLTHHAVKWSLLVVSVERLIAVKYPYKYCHYFKRYRVVSFLLFLWILTVIIDSVPFYNGRNLGDRCLYSPHVAWSLSVITVYNIIPFIFMVVCYALIWRVAATMELHDRKISRTMPLPVIALGDEASDTKRARTKLQEMRTRLRSSTIDRVPIIGRKSGRQESTSVSTTIIESRSTKSRRAFLLEMKATKTMFLLVVVYVCCWGPLGVFYTVDQFCSKCLSRGGSQRFTRVAIKGLCFSSSIIIPIVYCWFSGDYKKAARRLYNDARDWLQRR